MHALSVAYATDPVVGRRPSCGESATYRADGFESQIATLLDGIELTDEDVNQVLRAMTIVADVPKPMPLEKNTTERRRALQEALSRGEIGLPAFNREWRALDRPAPAERKAPDEIGLLRAKKALADFGALWRDSAVTDRLREEALREMFARVDIDGARVVAVHPQDNENAWLLGYHSLRMDVGLVGAKGFEPSTS